MKFMKIWFAVTSVIVSCLVGFFYGAWLICSDEDSFYNARKLFNVKPDRKETRTETKCEKVPLGFR